MGGAGVKCHFRDMAHHQERDDSYDLLNQYLQEIARIPRLTPEREKDSAAEPSRMTRRRSKNW